MRCSLAPESARRIRSFSAALGRASWRRASTIVGRLLSCRLLAAWSRGEWWITKNCSTTHCRWRNTKSKVARFCSASRAESICAPGAISDWEEFIDGAPPAECARVAATDPLYILYTSGTTGAPKGIVRDNGGHAVALLWSMEGIYDVRPGEVFWAASDIGWVVGHSYIVYAPFLRRATTVLYEGKPVGTPDAGAFWRVIAEHRVAVMFTAPTALRAIKKEDPQGESVRGHDLSRLRAQFVAGERCDPDTLAWAEKHLRAPVVDHWWQTETGWAITANPLGIEKFAVPPGAAGKPMPGYDLRVLDDDGVEEKRGELGQFGGQVAVAAELFPDDLGRRRPLCFGLFHALSGLLFERRFGADRRRRFRACDEPNRRCD